jgi:hypothetical protein
MRTLRRGPGTVTSDHSPLDLSAIKPQPFAQRRNKVAVAQFARAGAPGQSVADWLAALPDILAGHDLREIIQAISGARGSGCPVIVAMGAHVIKCGLSPVIIDLMERGLLTCLALNGAGSVHDSEIALFGATSEDVAAGIEDRSFGMAAETADFLNGAIAWGHREGIGMGAAIGRRLLEAHAPHADVSLLAAGARLGLPVTVHVALGTDIHHMHPSASGEAMGATSYLDFRILAGQVARLAPAGVLINAGSAVVLPVVIEKAIAAARAAGHDVGPFVGVNLDFIQHYRGGLNPVKRAAELGGRGYRLTGHHEILIPLLAAGVLAESGDGQETSGG